MQLWIATAVDYNYSCDGKARILGAFKSFDEAKNCVDENIKEWANDHGLDMFKCDFVRMSAWDVLNENVRCEWNIEEVEAK